MIFFGENESNVFKITVTFLSLFEKIEIDSLKIKVVEKKCLNFSLDEYLKIKLIFLAIRMWLLAKIRHLNRLFLDKSAMIKNKSTNKEILYGYF